jgi:hypothetical protein
VIESIQSRGVRGKKGAMRRRKGSSPIGKALAHAIVAIVSTWCNESTGVHYIRRKEKRVYLSQCEQLAMGRTRVDCNEESLGF